jgi:hypothetical protein
MKYAPGGVLFSSIAAIPSAVALSREIAVAASPDPLGRDEVAHDRLEMLAGDDGASGA